MKVNGNYTRKRKACREGLLAVGVDAIWALNLVWIYEQGLVPLLPGDKIGVSPLTAPRFLKASLKRGSVGAPRPSWGADWLMDLASHTSLWKSPPLWQAGSHQPCQSARQCLCF